MSRLPRTARPSPGKSLLPWDPATFRRLLHGWYRRQHRALPWRETRDPYAIWVSEVMLQQTRVSAVLEYYPRFLSRFPTLKSLARATPARVLAAWSGLGYYRRARHLLQAAQMVVREHAGQLPATLEGLMRLPGIGRSTAGAILSIGFEIPAPVLDGNVARVLSRVMASTPLQPTPTQLWEHASALLPRARGGLHTQAMMELGALVCLPSAPTCPICPLRTLCMARAMGLELEFPTPRARPRMRRVEEHAAVVIRSRRWLLVEREPGRALEGMRGLPIAPTLEQLLDLLGPGARVEAELPGVRHAILDRDYHTRVWRIRLPENGNHSGARYVSAVSMAEHPLDALTRKVLRAHGHRARAATPVRAGRAAALVGSCRT